MTTNFSGTPIPEISEGITKVEWLDHLQIQQALSNSYANIKDLL